MSINAKLVVRSLVAQTISFIRAGDGLVEAYMAAGLGDWEVAQHTAAQAVSEMYKCPAHMSQRGGYTFSNNTAVQQFRRIRAQFFESKATPKTRGMTDKRTGAIVWASKLSNEDLQLRFKALQKEMQKRGM